MKQPVLNLAKPPYSQQQMYSISPRANIQPNTNLASKI